MKTQLPNGCSYSTITVTPKNWQAKSAKISTNWFISYRYYDPLHDKPKQVIIKGMNYFKTLVERQTETNRLLRIEMKNLEEGFNPFIKQMGNHLSEPDHETLINALQLSTDSITVATRTKKDLMHVLSKCREAVIELGYEQLLIKDVSRKHLKNLLNAISKTNDRYNKNRSSNDNVIGKLSFKFYFTISNRCTWLLLLFLR